MVILDAGGIVVRLEGPAATTKEALRVWRSLKHAIGREHLKAGSSVVGAEVADNWRTFVQPAGDAG